jgi:cyclohexanecarboxyl-CoA dehydrogenase
VLDFSFTPEQEALRDHWHYGYTQELPIEQRLRDVIGWQIGDGTPQIQKLVIARQLLGRDFAPET